MSQAYYTQNPVKTLSEHDRSELKRAWRNTPAVWRFVPHRGDKAFLNKWLSRQSPADWHEIATKFDWDLPDLSPVLFIAKQPDADRASIMSMVLEQDLPLIERLAQDSGQNSFRDNAPQVAELLDLISMGFEKGWYRDQRFRLSHAQAALARTRVALNTLEHDQMWKFPAYAWSPVNGENHQPDYIWDATSNCQRLPFDVWARLKIRPH